MTDIQMILEGLRRNSREPISQTIRVTEETCERVTRLMLDNPEMKGVESSDFINRACEVAETAIVEQRGRDEFYEFLRRGRWSGY